MDGVFANALVDAAVGEGAGAGPAEDASVLGGEDERVAVGEPAGDVLGARGPVSKVATRSAIPAL
jgi:hypothetical protein